MKNLKKKLIGSIVSTRWKAVRDYRHFCAKFSRKHRFTLPRVGRIFFNILLVGVFVSFVMMASSIAPAIEDDTTGLLKDLVIAQITVVSIAMSIVALVANLDDKWIFGMRLNEALFRPSWLFRSLLLIPIALTFANLWMLSTGSYKSMVFVVFNISIAIMILFIWKTMRPFLTTDDFKEDLRRYYFRENHRQLIKARPLNDKHSQAMLSFRDVTLRYIVNSDPRADENINTYILLTEHSLSECKPSVQRYYTESLFHNDFLSHVAQFAEELFYRGKYLQGIRLDCQLYQLLNYYRVVNFTNHEMMNSLRQAAKAIRYIDNETLAEDYQRHFVRLCEEQWLQKDIFLSDNFEAYRLSDMLDLHFIPEDLLSGYYVALFENDLLDDHAKQRLFVNLFHTLRTTIKIGVITRQNNDDFSSKDWWGNTTHFRREYKNEYLCMRAVALMILEMMELKDDERLRIFLTMDFRTQSTLILKTTCALSLVHHIKRGSLGGYALDLSLDADTALRYLHNLGIDSLVHEKEDFFAVYQKLMHCCSEGHNDGSKEKKSLGFHPRLVVKEEVLNDFFFYLFERSGNADFFLEKSKLADHCPNAIIGDILNKAIAYKNLG